MGGVQVPLRLRQLLLPPGSRGQPRERRRGGRGWAVPPHALRPDAGGGLDREKLNELLEGWDDADDARRIGNQANSVGADWSFEKTLLRPLPDEPFDTALTLTPRVDRYAQVMVRCNQYSVPARFIGHRLRVKLSASTVTVLEKNTLLRKPGALPGATALVQARAAGAFTSTHDAFWAAARNALGDTAGTRALIEVLLLHRHLEHADVLAGITAC